MAFIVKSDPNASRREIRHRPSSDATSKRTPHWLLASLYGRELIKVALSKLYPQLAPEVDDHLEMVIDELQLRDWQEPKSMLARSRYLICIAKMYPMVSRGERCLCQFIC